MKILFEPKPEPPRRHDCGRGLWNLGDRAIGTQVACYCGNRWVCEERGMFLVHLMRERLKPGYEWATQWRLYDHVTADWDDVPGEEVVR